MNFANKIAIASIIGLITNVAVAADPVISLTSSQAKGDRMSALANRSASRTSSFELDFVAGDKAAAVVQFDIVVKSPREASIDLSKCGGTTVAGSDHLVFCRQISADRVRVLVDSPTNASVPTSSFGTILITGGSASIDQPSVVVGDAQGVAMTAEVL